MSTRFTLRLAAAGLAVQFAVALAGPVTLTNTRFRVEYDAARARFSIATQPTGKTFVENGALTAGGTVRVERVHDRVFGRGEALVVTHADGGQDAIQLFPKLPFVLFRTTLHNATDTTNVINHLPVARLPLRLGLSATKLRLLGTGGLESATNGVGSYVWLAVANPATRAGVVAGFLTENAGSGVVFTHPTAAAPVFTARIDYGRLRLRPGAHRRTETLAIGWFSDARLGLEAWADAVAQVYAIHLPPLPSGYCTWYSDQHGAASDEKHLAQLTAWAAKNLEPYGFRFVQIDDHWQKGKRRNGPAKNFTAANPNGPYPHGMKATADNIRAHGLRPGLWFMPFAGDPLDPVFQGHSDWFVHRPDGRLYETRWGGTSLDLTNPATRAYVFSVAHRIAHDWGFSYIKIDGLYTGAAVPQTYVNSSYKDDHMGDAVFHDPNATNLQAYRAGLKLVRQAAGTNVFILGCCAPQNMRSYGGAFGLLDAMRIGPDNGGSWKHWVATSPVFGSRNYFLNGRIWYNDPDAVYVRASLPYTEARTIVSWTALTGQLFADSDWLPALPPDRVELLRRCLPSHGLRPRPVDLFEHQPPRIWLLTDTRREPRRDVVGLFNWSERTLTFTTPVARIGLPPARKYVAFDFWGNRLVPPFSDHLQITVPPHDCRILAVRPVLNHPILLSTSRHITQGMVDVLAEHWDARRQTLSGRSAVVADDPYELRLYLPTATAARARASVSHADEQVGVGVSAKQNDHLVRVRLSSPVSRTVAWSVRFD